MLHYLSIAFVLLVLLVKGGQSQDPETYIGYYQPGCDLDAAKQCELDLLECRLFSGPADDPPTMCKCGEKFYGQCLRAAGCEFHEEFGPAGEIYMKKCIDHIYKYDCPPPDPLMCAVNCASEESISLEDSMVMFFNNYGKYYLRIRICNSGVHPLRLAQYGTTEITPCNDENDNLDDDFLSCARWIPPKVYTPVAIAKGATYIEVDSCNIDPDGRQWCDPNIPPVRIYGNSQVFPLTYSVPKSDFSFCSSDADCLGSFCELKLRPSTCSPKLKRHLEQSGKFYFEVD